MTLRIFLEIFSPCSSPISFWGSMGGLVCMQLADSATLLCMDSFQEKKQKLIRSHQTTRMILVIIGNNWNKLIMFARSLQFFEKEFLSKTFGGLKNGKLGNIRKIISFGRKHLTTIFRWGVHFSLILAYHRHHLDLILFWLLLEVIFLCCLFFPYLVKNKRMGGWLASKASFSRLDSDWWV